MRGTRLFEAGDVAQVARLWQRCFRKTSRPASAALQQYFIDLFLGGPWFHPDYRPLVYTAGDGSITGFLGRMHRPMQFQGRLIHCAVATQLMVDPDRTQPFCAFELMRALHAGPHDLAYSDGANDVSWHLWERCGGEACRLLSMEWGRPLRPAQAFFERFRQHEAVGALARVLQPCSGLFDAVAVRSMPRIYHKPRTRIHWRPATAAEIVPLFRRVALRASLTASYTDASFTWLLNRAAEARSLGALRTQIVTDADGEAVGWFIYYVRPGRQACVMQVGALPGEGRHVLDCLLRDAWEQDASSVSGQLDPQLLAHFNAAHCRLYCHGIGVLMQTKNPEIALAIHRGDAMLSRLDGEWWTRFGIDRKDEW